jgi:hypothetical protein
LPSTLPPLEPDGAVPDAAPADSSGTDAAAPATDATNALPEWAPLAAIIALLGALVGWWFLRRRRSDAQLALAGGPELAREAAPPPQHPAPAPVPAPIPAPEGQAVKAAGKRAKSVAAEPAPAEAESPPAPAAPPRATLGRRAVLSMRFEPLAASTTLLNFRMRYAVILTNEGTADAAPVTVRIGLFAGTKVNPNGIAQWLGMDDNQIHHGVDTIRAGTEYRFEGELAAPLTALEPLTVDGRQVAIPLVACDTRYQNAPGEAPLEGQVARAFVVGREPDDPAAKLGPFRLDLGPASFSPLGIRDTGIGRTE